MKNFNRVQKKEYSINVKVILSELDFLMFIYILGQREEEISFTMKILYQRLSMIVEAIRTAFSFFHAFACYFLVVMVVSFVFLVYALVAQQQGSPDLQEQVVANWNSLYSHCHCDILQSGCLREQTVLSCIPRYIYLPTAYIPFHKYKPESTKGNQRNAADHQQLPRLPFSPAHLLSQRSYLYSFA